MAEETKTSGKVMTTDDVVTIPVEYLADHDGVKKGDTAKLPVHQARSLKWRGVVRETNADKK